MGDDKAGQDRAGQDRRAFLKTLAVAGGAAVPIIGAGSAQSSEPAADAAAGVKDANAATAEAQDADRVITYPRTFAGAQLRTIAFPLGGVGAGSISLGGRGQLRDWEIFNRPDKGYSPTYAFPAIWAQRGNAAPFVRVLEARQSPPFEGASGLGANNVPGLPRLASAVFTGEFPIASIAFTDPELPVTVTLDAFTPFIPHDADESGLPVTLLRYRVHNPGAGPCSCRSRTRLRIRCSARTVRSAPRPKDA